MTDFISVIAAILVTGLNLQTSNLAIYAPGTLHRVLQRDGRTRYRVEVQFSEPGKKVTHIIRSMWVSTCKEVLAPEGDGRPRYIVEDKFDGTLQVMQSTVVAPISTISQAVYSEDGIPQRFTNSTLPIEVRAATVGAFVIGTARHEPGESWPVSIPAMAAIKRPQVIGTCKWTKTEKLAGDDCARIEIDQAEIGGESPMHFSATIWIRLYDHSQRKIEAKTTNYPLNGKLVDVNLKADIQ